MTFQLQTDKNPFQFHIMFVGMNPLKDGAGSRSKGMRSGMRAAFFWQSFQLACAATNLGSRH
jgi:hypothetical protein